jgi:nicotinate-nucleotide pyrophosphorylase (carboxylating)
MNKAALTDSIKRFLAEDIGQGDITSEAIFSDNQIGHATFIAKQSFLVCGMESVALPVFQTKNPAISCDKASPDGVVANIGVTLLSVTGPVIDLLAAERVALNLVQRLCGIATLTSRFVEKVKDLPVRIVDTRKTTPGLRMLEKYAVRVGGGHNHRFNLADAVLIKDNHIAACGSITSAVKQIRQTIPHTMKIEVEAETIDQVRECLACGVEVIMLDNMGIEQMREAVGIIKGKALLEASGGVTLENVRKIAETGVDIISIGALTHSANACDISMKLETD